jgi:hypothetical protein
LRAPRRSGSAGRRGARCVRHARRGPAIGFDLGGLEGGKVALQGFPRRGYVTELRFERSLAQRSGFQIRFGTLAHLFGTRHRVGKPLFGRGLIRRRARDGCRQVRLTPGEAVGCRKFLSFLGLP